MFHSYDHGGNIVTVARMLGVPVNQIFDFSASINPLGMSPHVRKTLVSSIDSLIHYPDASHAELKLALAEFHDLPPDNFTIANGSTELIYKVPAILSGRKALIISPSFSEYVRALRQHQWDIQHFVLKPENNFTIDVVALAGVLAGGVDVLFLCNPGNPNGTLYPRDVIEQICKICDSAGTFLVIDEAFMDFCEEASAKHIVALEENVVLLRSMTKFFGIPGLRLGYAVSNAAFADRLNSMGGPWSVNTLALGAGVAALQDEQHNQRSLEYIAQERNFLFSGLTVFTQLKVHPSCANYLLVEILEGVKAHVLKERLLSHRILIRDCGSFVGLSDCFFRVAVRTREENEKLLECLGSALH